jgi:hypothetical protein
MKKHPIITELQLGKSVEEVIKDHFSDRDFEVYSTEDRLSEIIKEIIRIGKKDLRFAVDVGRDSCRIFVLNAESDLGLGHYWDEENNWAMSSEAAVDCDVLNEIVERLYGAKRKKPKPKITNEMFVRKKGNICPYCGATKMIVVLDAETWSDRDEMGCRACGELWNRKYKIVVTGY